MALKPEEVRERYIKMRKRVKCLWTCAGVCLLASVTLPGMADSDAAVRVAPLIREALAGRAAAHADLAVPELPDRL